MLTRLPVWCWRIVWGVLGVIGLAGLPGDAQQLQDWGIPAMLADILFSDLGRWLFVIFAILIAAWRRDLQAIADHWRSEDAPIALGIGLKTAAEEVIGISQLDITLEPSSGPSPELTLELTNNGRIEEFYATYRILSVRNDPNPMTQPGTCRMPWAGHDEQSIVLQQGESHRLLVATQELWHQQNLGEIRLWSYDATSSNKRNQVTSSRWNMPQEKVPEYDLEITIRTKSNRNPLSHDYRVKPKSWHGGLEMREIPANAPIRGTVIETTPVFAHALPSSPLKTSPDDWHRMEADFNAIQCHDYLVLDWSCIDKTNTESWDVRGPMDSVTRFKAASRIAGRLLVKSYHYSQKEPNLCRIKNDEERWYAALKKRTHGFKMQGYATQEDGSKIFIGDITNPHNDSATLCYELASLE